VVELGYEPIWFGFRVDAFSDYAIMKEAEVYMVGRTNTLNSVR
jgi:hypothetical protein